MASSIEGVPAEAKAAVTGRARRMASWWAAARTSARAAGSDEPAAPSRTASVPRRPARASLRVRAEVSSRCGPSQPATTASGRCSAMTSGRSMCTW